MEPQAKEQNQNETRRKENLDLRGGVAVHQASFRHTCNKKESECEHAPIEGPKEDVMSAALNCKSLSNS